MVRTPSCDKSGMRKGIWTPEEDSKLIAYVTRYGSWNWRQLPRFAGLARCGKSCRLRWMNYLRPNVKRGNFTQQEEECIIRMHKKLGNRWSTIAAELPGRTDNEIKNHWHTTLKKRSQQNTLTKEEARASKSKDKVIPNKGVSVTLPATSSQFSDNSSLSPASSTSSEFFNITSDHSTAASIENFVFEDDDEFGFLDSNIDPMNNESFWKELTLDDISFNNAPIVSEDTNGSFQSTSSSNSNTLDSLHQSTSESIVVDNDFGGFVDAYAESTVDNFWTQPFVADMSSYFPTEVLAASDAESEYFTPIYDDLWGQTHLYY